MFVVPSAPAICQIAAIFDVDFDLRFLGKLRLRKHGKIAFF